MVFPFFADGRVTRGLSYDGYMQVMADQADTPTAGLPPEEAEKIGFTKLNLHRSLRITRSHTLDPELTALVQRQTEPTIWMLLTEPWCGDSAQCLPYIKLLADQHPALDLRIILRDAHLDIMDAFLTDGKRSIPRLVVFSPQGDVQGQWGPRPAEAQVVFDEARAAGLEKPQLLEKLHLWYGRNRGKALEAEFKALLSGMSRA